MTKCTILVKELFSTSILSFCMLLSVVVLLHLFLKSTELIQNEDIILLLSEKRRDATFLLVVDLVDTTPSNTIISNHGFISGTAIYYVRINLIRKKRFQIEGSKEEYTVLLVEEYSAAGGGIQCC